MCEGAIFPAACMGDAKIPEGVPISLGNLAWACQILGGARFPMTPDYVVSSPSLPSVARQLILMTAVRF